MIGALLYLQSQSTWNRLLARLKRLKKPKYLVGLVVGGLYFYFYFIRFAFSGGKRPAAGASFAPSPEMLQTFETLGALVLFILVISAWIFPRERAALAFTEAEVAFLFPAPIRRRTLIHYKLLRSQFGILFTTLLMALMTRQAWHGGNGWIHLAGWWLVFSTLNLHLLAASFTRTRLLDLGISVWLRRAVALMLVLVLLGAALIWARKNVSLPTTRDFRNQKTVSLYAQRALGSGPASYVLLPFRLVVRPYFALNSVEFMSALWPVLGLLALHYLWVIRSNVAFEEASADLARKRAELIGAVRQGRTSVARPKRKRDPFRLKPTGPPAVALLWKNLIAMGSAFSMRTWLILAFVFGVWGFAFTTSSKNADLLTILALLTGMALFLTVLIGPQLLRQDFRRDLRAVDVLKLYPLPGWRVVLGELLAPACVLTAIQWLLLWVAVMVFTQSPGGGAVAWSTRVCLAAGAAMIVPMLNLLSLLIPNAAVLLFPAWFQSGQDGLQGIEATGQRLVFALGQFLVLIFALVPAVLAFAVIFFLAQLAVPWAVAVPVAALAAAIILAAEVAGGLASLGKVFERFDLSAELQSS
jgi:hypothetical protein